MIKVSAKLLEVFKGKSKLGNDYQTILVRIEDGGIVKLFVDMKIALPEVDSVVSLGLKVSSDKNQNATLRVVTIDVV